MFFENVTARYYGIDNGGGNVGSGSWDLPKPRTRKEYYMAILTSGDPGTDFPERAKTKIEEESESSTATLDPNYSGTGYRYYVVINDDELGRVISIILQGSNGEVYLNTIDITDTCSITYDERHSYWQLSVILQNTLASDAVVIKAVYSKKYIVSPKTIEESYYAFYASRGLNENCVYPHISPKTRKEVYLANLAGLAENDPPMPKTREEYFLATANGLTPGEDFPDRSTIETESEEHDNIYIQIDKGYSGEKYGYCFDYPAAGFEHEWVEGDVMLVNGVDVSASVQFDSERCCFEFDTPLTGPSPEAYVDIAVQWPESIPLQPKTMEEAFYAFIAEIDVSDAVSHMKVRTRKDKYLNAIIENAGN